MSVLNDGVSVREIGSQAECESSQMSTIQLVRPTPTQLAATRQRQLFREKIAARYAALTTRPPHVLHHNSDRTQMTMPSDLPVLPEDHEDSTAAEMDIPAYPVIPETPVNSETPAPRITIARIQSATARHFATTVESLKGPSRKRDLVRPRQIAVYLARELTSSSTTVLGRWFGKRDHTTIMHAQRKIRDSMRKDADLAQDVAELIEAITSDRT